MTYFYYDAGTDEEINDVEINSLTKCLDNFYNLSEEDGSFFGLKDEDNNIMQFMYDDIWIIDIPIKETKSSLTKEVDFNECTDIINSFYKQGFKETLSLIENLSELG